MHVRPRAALRSCTGAASALQRAKSSAVPFSNCSRVNRQHSGSRIAQPLWFAFVFPSLRLQRGQSRHVCTLVNPCAVIPRGYSSCIRAAYARREASCNLSSLDKESSQPSRIVEGIGPGIPTPSSRRMTTFMRRKRDEGVVEHVDHDGTPTVRFARTGTATIVRPHGWTGDAGCARYGWPIAFALGRKVGREWCSWRLVRFVGTTRGGFVDVQSWTGAELDLFGMLAMMVGFGTTCEAPV